MEFCTSLLHRYHFESLEEQLSLSRQSVDNPHVIQGGRQIELPFFELNLPTYMLTPILRKRYFNHRKPAGIPLLVKFTPKPNNSSATHRHFDSSTLRFPHRWYLLLYPKCDRSLATAQVCLQSSPIMLPAQDVCISIYICRAPFIMLMNPMFVNAPECLGKETTPAAPTYAKKAL